MNNGRPLVVVLFLAAALLFVYNGTVEARSGYLTEFNSLYGTANTVLDDCMTCHGDSYSKSVRNPYGVDMEAELNGGSSPTEALVAIEPVDSDGDGYVNIDEINALAKPGDPNDSPGEPTCTDADGDGYAVEGGNCGAVDCNDADPAVNPGAVEDCTDGIDNDCDGLIDTADPDAVNCPVCTDADGDGYAIEGGNCGPVDCDDANPAVSPGAPEVCDDTVDNDCDGLADCGNDPDCDTDPVCGPVCEPVTEICTDGIDNDCDATIDCDDRNCRRDAACVVVEICDDGIDNDGDGKTDCADKKDCGKDPACA